MLFSNTLALPSVRSSRLISLRRASNVPGGARAVRVGGFGGGHRPPGIGGGQRISLVGCSPRSTYSLRAAAPPLTVCVLTFAYLHAKIESAT
ncbi:hypothetical protein EVAR_32659_1 [Eumeta japonica]|uniref:Uncharacterized protein n=1 Tax=Eumeta variegata TaxID=151549 RepID=A0A4C1WUL1_EUMVA|nr:hypothetical protein EVAR_32659_1 [Eumeta japonica]